VLESVLSAALASIASQGFELLIGAKDKFFWKNVALGALGGVINAGLPTDFAKGLGKWGQLAAKAALSNALTQGIAVTTGLQPKFDWKAVATSAIAAPLGQALGDSLLGTQYDSQGKVSGHEDTSFTRFLSPMGAQFTQAVADVLVGTVRQGIRMAVYGKGKLDFASIAADAFGSALGNSVMSQVNHYQQAKAQAAMSEPGSGFGLRATPKNWAAFNEGLTNTINANQKARQGTAPEGNPGLSPEAIRAAAALQAAYEGYGKPTGERTFITGRDVNNVSEAFYKTHRRAPTPTEAIALGNYNRLSDAHSVGRNRVLAVPNDLSVLDAYGANEEQLAAYNAAAKRFDVLKEQAANAALSDMFRTYKDGKLYVSPQNRGLYDNTLKTINDGVTDFQRKPPAKVVGYEKGEPEASLFMSPFTIVSMPLRRDLSSWERDALTTVRLSGLKITATAAGLSEALYVAPAAVTVGSRFLAWEASKVAATEFGLGSALKAGTLGGLLPAGTYLAINQGDSTPAGIAVNYGVGFFTGGFIKAPLNYTAGYANTMIPLTTGNAATQGVAIMAGVGIKYNVNANWNTSSQNSWWTSPIYKPNSLDELRTNKKE